MLARYKVQPGYNELLTELMNRIEDLADADEAAAAAVVQKLIAALPPAGASPADQGMQQKTTTTTGAGDVLAWVNTTIRGA